MNPPKNKRKAKEVLNTKTKIANLHSESLEEGHNL